MVLSRLDPRLATVVRIIALVLIGWTVVRSEHHLGGSGRGLVITVCFVVCIVAWLVWTIRPDEHRITPDVYLLAVAGGLLAGAAPDTAASAFVFIAVAAAGLRAQLPRAFVVVALGSLALASAVLAYDGSAIGLLAYTLGFTAMALAASTSRQSRERADQAELLLAQTQRSHEEQLRTARLEESTRIAREIHDVLAHTLAGLTIQLEATSSLVEQGADRDTVLARVKRAHALAREGLEETRQAVGALRGESVSAAAGIEALVADYRASADAPADVTVDGDPARLTGPTGQAVLRVAQEALTNIRKHAPGADVSVAVHAGQAPDDDVVLLVEDRPLPNQPAPSGNGLAASGGGYGLQGMRERAALLGGTLDAGAAGEGWRVELRLPPPKAPAIQPGRVR
ncbi:MAG TPA: sensor histidine kinase [Solirubrobacteraceae bacterium]|nr:sensor histidine kinase [Solirubrobacteraceae bacterium]